MSDIFSEIDEDLRRDRLKALWQRHQWLIVGSAALVIVSVGGWRGYGAWQASQADANGDRYLAAIELAQAGKHDEAIEAFGKLVSLNTSGYAALAALRRAGELAASGKASEAIGGFDAISADNRQPASLRSIALLRSAYLLIDKAPGEVASRLMSLNQPTNPFRHAAREALGLASYKSADLASAKRYFESLITDPEAPAGMRNRGNLMLTLLAGESPAQAESKQ